MAQPLERAARPRRATLDRNFADYALIAYVVAHQRDAVIRLKTKCFKACEEFWNSDQPEAIVTLHAPPSALEFVRQHQLPHSLSIRLIRVMLSTGETESGPSRGQVLLTTLLDSLAYPASEFKAVYGSRWNQETFFESGPSRPRGPF